MKNLSKKIMKKIFFLSFSILLGLELFAQETGNDSYTIQRLLIYNQKGEVLLEKNDFGWMTPALRHNSKVTINDGLINLASEFGLRISSPKISGIFMFMSDYKPISQFRQHYSCNVVDGQLKVPENKLDVQWFSINKAIEMMSLPDTKAPLVIRDMTKQLLYYPEIIWGGAYLLSKKNGEISYKTTEQFYPMR
jgi:hypothetical protein